MENLHRDGSPVNPGRPSFSAEVAGDLAGGYVLIPSRTLCLAAEAVARGELRRGDIHCLLAIAEAAERRKFSKLRKFDACEVAGMLNVGLARAGAAIRRLMMAGVVRWSPRAAGLVCEPRGESEPGFGARESAYGKPRLIPFPRRMLRHLIETARPALTWTALGHAGRMLYRHGDVMRAIGTCSASWLTAWAPLDERSVRRSRRELDARGWYRRVDAPHRAHRRGQLARVELAWEAPALSGSRGRRRRGLSPPCIRPALAYARSGDQRRGAGLARIEEGQLRDRESLAALFARAVGSKLVADTPDGCLRFCAAARHATSGGARNPGGLFVWSLRRGLVDLSGAALQGAVAMQERIKPSPRPPARRTSPTLSATTPTGDRRAMRPAKLAPRHVPAVEALESSAIADFAEAAEFLMGRGVPLLEARAVARLKFGIAPLVRYERSAA